MEVTIVWIFLLGAIVTAIMSAAGKCPLYVSVFCLCVVCALGVIPVR